MSELLLSYANDAKATDGTFKMAEDDTLASMPMAGPEPEPEQDEEGHAMWPPKREEQ